MNKSDSRTEAKQARISGYYHHQYEFEKMSLIALLHGDEQSWESELTLSTYKDVLAPQPFRAMKNAAICLVAVICRVAIDIGVDPEQSFSLSDYFIEKIEKQTDKGKLQALVTDILQTYKAATIEKHACTYSIPVNRSIRYINQHLYGPCRSEDVAKAADVHPAYLSSLFKKVMEIGLSKYIRQMKLDESRNLLAQTSYSITEIAEILGFCDTAYFSNTFKKAYGTSPRAFRQSSL